MQPFTHMTSERVQSREEMRSQGQTSVKKRLSPQLPPTMLSDKQSIQEVTHESPPHNSHVATLKLRGPPILPWKVYKRYNGKRLKRKKSRERSFCPKKCSILWMHCYFTNSYWTSFPSFSNKGLLIVCYHNPRPKSQQLKYLHRWQHLVRSIQWSSIAGAAYLAGRGFVGCLQLLWQLAGAVAGCVMERQRTMNQWVTNSLVSFTAAVMA